MATCKLCSKSGWFLKVTREGLCDPCNFDYLSTVERSGQILQDSLKIIQSSKNPMTRLSRIKVGIDNCNRMLRFHRAGLPTITPSPPELAISLDKARAEVLEDFVQAELLKVRARSSSARTRSSKATPYSRLLEKLAAFYTELEDVSVVDHWDRFIRQEMATVEVKAEIEEAEKLEHRGERKKALALYKDALFVLDRSDLPEDERARMAAMLNAKIAGIQGSARPEIGDG